MKQEIKVDCILKTAPEEDLEAYALITCVIEVPYFIWTEILTHKRFARNASSNRAMKVDTNINLGFFTPETFLSQGKGMQSADALSPQTQAEAGKIWYNVWKYCSRASKRLSDLGVAKEQASRVLPAFKIMRGILTGTQDAWNKFFELRLSEKADSAMQEFARKAKEAIEKKEYQHTHAHLPFILPEEKLSLEEIIYVSAGRIARISYGVINNKSNDFELGKRLEADGHWSPFEHTAVWVDSADVRSALCSKRADVYTEDFRQYAWQNSRNYLEKGK